MTEKAQDESRIPDGTSLVESLLHRCEKLLAELEAFRDFAEQRKLYRYNPVEIGQLKTTVGTEYKSLQKVCYIVQNRDRHNTSTDRLPAFRDRPDSRTDNSHAPFLQLTLLRRHLGSRKREQLSNGNP